MGLLDLFNTYEGQQGLGLLAAASARSDGAGFGQRLQEGLGMADNWKRKKAQDEFQQMQIADHMARIEEAKAQRAQQATDQTAVRGALSNGQLDPRTFLQGNPNASLGALDQAMKYSKMMNPTSEFSTAPQYDQKGRAFILAKDGTMKYLDGVMARDKLEEVRLGDKVGFRSPYSSELQGALPIGVSPSDQVAMRGQNMTDSRARDLNAISQDLNNIKRGEKQAEKEQAKAGQVASFDVMLGSLDRLSQHPGLSRSVGVVGAFPTMPGSESANFKAELDTFQSQAFIPMVSQLKGMGALSDAEGKKLTAAVGALSPSMGEKAFRESVARITSDMSSARDRLTGGASKPMESLPAANASNKGRAIRDTATGKVLRSNGMSWVEEK